MKRKILIAEDSLTVQRVFELAFVRSDYQVTYVDGGKDLKDMALELNPALIICDASLPDSDGYDVVSELKREPALMKVPVVLLVGSIEPFDEDRYKSSDADGVLFKPFDSQEMIDKVEELIREHQVDSEEKEVAAQEMSEEGWDFSDVFEDVDMGVETGDAVVGEEPFIAELVSETDLPDMQSVGDFDVGVDELGGDEELKYGPGEEKDEIVMAGTTEHPDELEEELDAVDEFSGDLEAGETVDSEGVEEALSEVREEVLDSASDPVVHDEPAKEPESYEPQPVEMEEKVFSKEIDEEERVESLSRMDEEDRMMEEIVRDVNDFPISTGYESKSHRIMRPAPSHSAEVKDKMGEFEDTMKEYFSSDEFRNELKGLVAEISEKILWEVVPRIMEDAKREVVAAMKEISASVVPEIAERIIREEIQRIREEVGPGD